MSQRRRMPDFEKPAEEASVSGIVKNVVGNEVTVLKIERQGGFGNGTNSGFEVTEKKNEKEEKTQGLNITGFGGDSGGMRGGPGGGMGGGRPSETGESDTDERLEMLKTLSTGEEKVTIPVGIKMLKNEDGKMIEATITDVTKDTMLMIWTDASITDKNIANFVIIN